jgi:hypothetical protein
MDLAPPAPQFGRALLTLTAAATIAVSPVAAAALGPADSGQGAHSIPVYLFARLAHDIGHNDWAFQGQTDGRVAWAATYAALGVFWIAIALWVRWRARRGPGGSDGAGTVAGLSVDARGAESAVAASAASAGVALSAGAGADIGFAADGGMGVGAQNAVSDGMASSAGVEAGVGIAPTPSTGLWWKVLLAALGVEAVAGCLTIGIGLFAAWNSWAPDTALLHASDLCSPWWSCVAAGLVAARAERSRTVLRATVGYGLLLVIVLVVPLPVPDLVRVLVLAVPAAAPALLRTPSEPEVGAGTGPESVGAPSPETRTIPTGAEADAVNASSPETRTVPSKPGVVGIASPGTGTGAPEAGIANAD